MGYRLEIDPRKVDRVVGTMTRGMVEKGTTAAMNYAKDFAPRDTGRLANSIVSVVEKRGFLHYVGTIYSHEEYALYQEKGTRAHGPVRAKYLRFKPKGSSTYVFAKWVRGVPATKYMERALEWLSMSDFV